MQGVWSRAAQLQGCHCRACSRAANTAIAGTRPTRTAAPTAARRRVRFSDVLTACYTTIMATAAVVDAGYKDQRREKLDRQIDEAKSKLARLMEDAAVRDIVQGVASAASFAQTFDGRSQTRWRALASICQWRPDSLLEQAEKLQDRKVYLGRLSSALSLKTIDSDLHRAPDIWSLVEIGDLIAVEEAGLTAQQREPVTKTQFSKASDMVNDLADGLLDVIYAGIDRQHLPLDSGWSAIRMLRSDGYPHFRHTDLDPSRAARSRSNLNEANRLVMERWDPYKRANCVAKICFNLLASDFLPGIHNYNTLIWGFTQLGEHDLAHAVVDSLLFKSRLLPTSATIACLLHHYRLKGDIAGFYAVIRRLSSHDVRGLGLRRRRLEEARADPNIRKWAREKDVSLVGGYLVQRVSMNRLIWEALLRGLLEFNRIGHAAKVFVVCLQERCVVSMDLLNDLLRACITHVDHYAARVLAEGFLENIDQTTAIILQEKLPANLVNKFYRFLSICDAQVLSGSSSSSSSSSYNAAVPDPRRVQAVQHLTAALWIRQTRSQLVWIRHCTALVQRALLSPDEPLLARLEAAIAVIDRFARGQRLKTFRRNLFQRFAKIDWLNKEAFVAYKNGRTMTHKINNAMAKSIPRPLRALTLFNFRVPFEKRLELHLDLVANSRTSLKQAASCFERSQDLDGALKWALLNALPLPMAEGIWDGCETINEVNLKRLMDTFTSYLLSLKLSLETDDEDDDVVVRSIEPSSGPGGPAAVMYAV